VLHPHLTLSYRAYIPVREVKLEVAPEKRWAGVARDGDFDSEIHFRMRPLRKVVVSLQKQLLQSAYHFGEGSARVCIMKHSPRT